MIINLILTDSTLNNSQILNKKFNNKSNEALNLQIIYNVINQCTMYNNNFSTNYLV